MAEKKLSFDFAWKVAAVVFFIIAAILLFQKCNKEVVPVTTVMSDDSLTFWKNRAGKAVASEKKLAEEFAVMDLKYRDSIAKIYSHKKKSIKETFEVASTVETDLDPKGTPEWEYYPVKIDSCPPVPKNVSQIFENKYYRAVVQIGEKSFLRLKGSDTLTGIWTEKKEGKLLNKKTYLQLDVSNSNPYVSITGVKVFKSAPIKQKKFGLSVQAGYGGMITMSRKVAAGFYVGVGGSYTFIRF